MDAPRQDGGRAAGAEVPLRGQPAPTGPAFEVGRLVAWLSGDLVSIPFHLVAFLFRRGHLRRQLRRTIEESSS